MNVFERVRSWTRAVPHFGMYAGLVLIVTGAGLIVFAWGKTAGMTDVALQVPYVISAGVTGLALVVVGVTSIHLSVKRADAETRREQLDTLRNQIDDLTKLLEGKGKR